MPWHAEKMVRTADPTRLGLRIGDKHLARFLNDEHPSVGQEAHTDGLGQPVNDQLIAETGRQCAKARRRQNNKQ